MRVFYLHGFASSAKSSKAAFFASRFASHGIELQIPDFNEPDFSTLTVTRMIAQLCDRIAGRPDDRVVLIGSSLGGFVAVNTAMRCPDRVDRIVLLAPALDFGGNRLRSLGDRGLEDWSRSNRLDVFHHGFGRVIPVHYELYADATRYDAMNARLDIPVQIFQGRRDDAVDPETVERWARARPGIVELHMLDDDHQLHASLESIWPEVARFVGVMPAASGP
jgi:pimeloyl-ACP methyl ester carboxylesterase